MRVRNKITVLMRLKDGFETKCWQNIPTGAVFPTNWKIQAGFLSGVIPFTKRLQNRHRRKEEARKSYFRLQQAVA